MYRVYDINTDKHDAFLPSLTACARYLIDYRTCRAAYNAGWRIERVSA